MKFKEKVAIRYIRTKFRILSSVSKKKAAEKAFELFRTPMRRNKKQPPPIFTQARKLQFKMDNVTVRGWQWNQDGNKTALILHGFESSVVNFDRYIRPLLRKDYQVLAFDAPAHGRSGGKIITAPLYKEMIKKVHQDFGPIDSFLAHSFGGLAVCLALEEMDHDMNTRLVLIAPATETTTAIGSFFQFLRLDGMVREEFEKIIIRAGKFPSSWYSIRRAMQNIRARVLWFHDEDDETTPLSDVYRVREENYSNIQFVISSGLGHRRIYRDNKVTKAILDFL